MVAEPRERRVGLRHQPPHDLARGCHVADEVDSLAGPDRRGVEVGLLDGRFWIGKGDTYVVLDEKTETTFSREETTDLPLELQGAVEDLNRLPGKIPTDEAALYLVLRRVPVGRVAAGSPILAQEHVDKTYYVESGLFQRRPDYLLKVRGMSMRDAGIMDGDLLAVQATRDAKNGQIVVARIGDDVTVKRFRRNKHVIELHAENPDYPTIVVEPGEPFEIEGVAVGLIRNTMLM